MRAIYSLLFPTMVAMAPSSAQQVYKTVDEDGNISYSSEPPPEGATETLQALPEPDQADVEAAQQRQQKIEEDLKEQIQARREQAEREAQYNASSGSTIVVNTPPAVIPGPYYRPHHHRWHSRDRRDRDRHRPVPAPAH